MPRQFDTTNTSIIYPVPQALITDELCCTDGRGDRAVLSFFAFGLEFEGNHIFTLTFSASNCNLSDVIVVTAAKVAA